MLCPSVAPTEQLARLLLRDTIGSDPFGKDKGKAIEQTLKQYMEVMEQAINNPQAIVERSFQVEEQERKIDADLQIMMKYSCDDPRISKLFTNALSFLENPIAGVSPQQLRLRDICIANEMKGSNWEDARDLCNCTTDKMLATLSHTEKTFVTQRPEENWGVLLLIYPKYQVKVQQCTFDAMKPIDFK